MNTPVESSAEVERFFSEPKIYFVDDNSGLSEPKIYFVDDNSGLSAIGSVC